MRKRIIQIGWAGLTIVSFWVFAYGLVFLYSYSQNLPASQVAALASANMSAGLFFALNVVMVSLVYLAFFVVAQLIMFRRAHDNFSLLAGIVLLAFGTGNAASPLPGAFDFYFNDHPAFVIPYNAFNFLGWTLIAAFGVSYPDGKFVPRWTLAPAIFGFLVSALWTTNPATFSHVEGTWALVLLGIVLVGYGSVVYAHIWRYRHYYSALQKQQVKWFVVGVIGILVTVVPTVLLYPRILEPSTPPAELLQSELLFLLGSCALIVMPISIGVAILRYRLWDIDIIIRKTLTYAIVAALLALVYFGTVVLLQQVFASVTGQRNQVITVLSTLAIAALFVPLRNSIQKIVDRRFYRNTYDAQQVLSDFAGTVRDETNLEKLTGRLMQVVDETMQPNGIMLWLKEPPAEK